MPHAPAKAILGGMNTIPELLRLIHNLIRLGTIDEIDHGEPGVRPPRVRVRSGDLLTGWLPWIVVRAGTTIDWDPPTEGEQVLIFSPGGDPACGIVLPALYRAQHSAPSSSPDLFARGFPDGARIQYDHENHVADITLPEGAVLNLVSDGGFNITGDVAIIGSLHASGDVSDGARSMAADRAIYNDHNHPGDSGGTTGNPNQQQ